MIHVDGALLEGGGQRNCHGIKELIPSLEKRFSVRLHPWRRHPHPRHPSEPIRSGIESATFEWTTSPHKDFRRST